MPPFEHDDATREILAATLHDVPDSPDPLLASRSISRGTTIVGLMLEYLGDKYGGWKSPGGVLARFGQVAWGLVELAAPRSLGQVLFQYWIAIAYALSVLMILVGILTNTSAVTRAGYLVLVVSVVTNIVLEKLRRWMNTKDARQLRPMIFAIPLALSAVGGGVVYQHISSIEAQMVQNGAPQVAIGKRAGLLQTSTDLPKALGDKQGNVSTANPILMTASLGWDSLFIVCYSVAFLSLGWILATQFDRPYRAFSMVFISTAVAVGADAIENLQAYFALANFRGWAPVYTTDLKMWAAGITVVFLIVQTLVVWFREASAGV